jgi:hypothetical protein
MFRVFKRRMPCIGHNAAVGVDEERDAPSSFASRTIAKAAAGPNSTPPTV